MWHDSGPSEWTNKSYTIFNSHLLLFFKFFFFFFNGSRKLILSKVRSKWEKYIWKDINQLWITYVFQHPYFKQMFSVSLNIGIYGTYQNQKICSVREGKDFPSSMQSSTITFISLEKQQFTSTRSMAHNLLNRKIKSNCEYGKEGICLNSFDYEKVTDKVDGVNTYNMIYLEFLKALNEVPHDRHLLKLKAAGIQNKACKWIKKMLKTEHGFLDKDDNNVLDIIVLVLAVADVWKCLLQKKRIKKKKENVVGGRQN